MEGVLDKNESMRYHYLVPNFTKGLTIRICVSEGHIVSYGSHFIPNPNSAFYNWKMDIKAGEMCREVFVDPQNVVPDQWICSDSSPHDTVLNNNLSITVVGQEFVNRFNLSSNFIGEL